MSDPAPGTPLPPPDPTSWAPPTGPTAAPPAPPAGPSVPPVPSYAPPHVPAPVAEPPVVETPVAEPPVAEPVQAAPVAEHVGPAPPVAPTTVAAPLDEPSESARESEPGSGRDEPARLRQVPSTAARAARRRVRRRRPRWLPIAVIALIAIGIGAIVAATRGGDEEAGDDGPYSFGAAVEAAAAGQAARFEVGLDIGVSGSLTSVGVVDDAGRVELTTELGPGLGRIEMVLDPVTSILYVRGDQLGELAAPGAEWIAINLQSSLQLRGVDGQTLAEQVQAPADMAKVLRDLSPTEIGPTTIDGEDVVEYRVELTGDELIEALESNPLFTRPQVDPGAPALPDRIEYTVYVTEQNTLRRMVMTTELLGDELVTTVDQYPLDDGYVVELPPDDQVTFIDDDGLVG